jgi:transcriptional regulator with XRE-family HTH domain
MLSTTNTKGLIRKQRKLSREFRKEAFEVVEYYFERESDGEMFSTSETDELAMLQVYNLYRARHHIPFPDEIRNIRLEYGLSAAKMSEVLDLGANSYRNYEHGEVPSLANAKLIRMASNPRNFQSFVQEKKDIFSPNIYKRVTGNLARLMEEDKLDTVVEYLWNFHTEPNEFTGFVKPKLQKVANFVLFFAEKARPLKTRLNKLLFYADFLNFQQTGFAISGCNYRAIPFGPVPSHFHELFGLLEAEQYLSIEQEMFEHGGIGERFVAAKDFDASLFTKEELDSMNRVLHVFEEVRTRQIIEMSHQETAWAANHENRELISYQQHAYDLKAIS